MADDDRRRRHARPGEDVELLDAHRALVGVRGDRRPGREVRGRGGAQHELLVGRDLVRAGRNLDDAGPDAGRADALGQLVDEEVGHLLHRVAELGAEFEVRRRTVVLLVETGGADDPHAALLGDRRHELDVATQVDRARVEERAHAELAQLEHAVDADLGALAVHRPVLAGVRLPARPADEQVLVHQRWPERVRRAATAYGLNGSHEAQKSPDEPAMSTAVWL